MKTCSLLTALCSLAAFTLVPVAGADTLAEKLEEVGLGALIGTWVDPDSNGDQITVTYTWRVKDHALGMSVKTPNRTSEALIGLDPKTGEVIHTTHDDKGGSGQGKWAEENDVATLTLTVIDSEKKETLLKITHKIVDNKQLVVGMKRADNDEGGEITLVRKAE
ncbi:MAG: hypothetical protein ACKJSK_18545 [Roseibacillus sp.]|tara:strand:+ start:323 stop:814 length:492 start_codon:yes stop_codon:yes gene_type:complete